MSETKNEELRLQPHWYLSAIYDRDRECAIVLDERRGIYYSLTLEAFRVLCFGVSNISLAEDIEYKRCVSSTSFDTYVDQLCTAQLLTERPRPKPQAKNKTNPPAVPWLITSQKIYPPLFMVVLYIGAIIYFKLCLVLMGWYPVWMSRSSQLIVENHESISGSPTFIAEQMLSAIRLACAIPGMRRHCVPNALAIQTVLRIYGYASELVIGADVVPFEPHIWTELDGYRIDSGADELALLRFYPLNYWVKKLHFDI